MILDGHHPTTLEGLLYCIGGPGMIPIDKY